MTWLTNSMSSKLKLKARAELAKLLPRLQVPCAAVSLLQKQLAMAKRNFAKAKAAERQRRLQSEQLSEVEARPARSSQGKPMKRRKKINDFQ